MPKRRQIAIFGLLVLICVFIICIYEELLDSSCLNRKARTSNACTFDKIISKNTRNIKANRKQIIPVKEAQRYEQGKREKVSSQFLLGKKLKIQKQPRMKVKNGKIHHSRVHLNGRYLDEVEREYAANVVESTTLKNSIVSQNSITGKASVIWFDKRIGLPNSKVEKNTKKQKGINLSRKEKTFKSTKINKRNKLLRFTMENRLTPNLPLKTKAVLRRPGKANLESKGERNSNFNKLKDAICPRWKIYAEDWTLKYENDLPKVIPQKCKIPDINSKIKRIIHKNGTTVYVGCSKGTFECRETAHYDFNLGTRINTPPCCRNHILTMFEHMTQELGLRRVSYCMISGGVIGWVRNKKIVPYDRDLDLVVDIKFWNTTSFWDIMSSLNRKYGYEYKLVEPLKLKLYFSKTNRNEIDLWAYWVKDGAFHIDYGKAKKQQAGTMMPFRAVDFEWFKTFVPYSPKEYLDRQYGKHMWAVEKQCMVRDGEENCW